MKPFPWILKVSAWYIFSFFVLANLSINLLISWRFLKDIYSLFLCNWILLCSVFTQDSSFRNCSWWVFGENKRYWGFNMSWPCAKQVTYPMYYSFSLWKNFTLWRFSLKSTWSILEITVPTLPICFSFYSIYVVFKLFLRTRKYKKNKLLL